jgi:hypothetical protein
MPTVLGVESPQVLKKTDGLTWTLSDAQGKVFRGVPFWLAFRAPRGLLASPTSRVLGLLSADDLDWLRALEWCLAREPFDDHDRRVLAEKGIAPLDAQPFLVTRDSPCYAAVRSAPRRTTRSPSSVSAVGDSDVVPPAGRVRRPPPASSAVRPEPPTADARVGVGARRLRLGGSS